MATCWRLVVREEGGRKGKVSSSSLSSFLDPSLNPRPHPISSAMSSFRRIKPSSAPAPPPGTIVFPSVSLPHLSTGLASLDDVLAPGQPLSSALLILTPDAHSAWGKLMQRYWLSQGLLTGQGVVVVGGEGEGEELVEGAMWEAPKPGAHQPSAAAALAKGEESASDGEGLEEEEEAGKKKIAWRYGGMGKFKTTVDSSQANGELDSVLGHPLARPFTDHGLVGCMRSLQPTRSTTRSRSLTTSPSRRSLPSRRRVSSHTWSSGRQLRARERQRRSTLRPSSTASCSS